MQSFIAILAAADCDPEVESCSAIARQDQFERPPIDDFASVTLAYIWHPLAQMLTFLLTVVLSPNADVGDEALLYILVPVAGLYVN